MRLDQSFVDHWSDRYVNEELGSPECELIHDSPSDCRTWIPNCCSSTRRSLLHYVYFNGLGNGATRCEILVAQMINHKYGGACLPMTLV